MNQFKALLEVFRKASPYSLYVLFILFLTFMLNQLDRFALPVTNKDSAMELKYGNGNCFAIKNVSAADTKLCDNAENEKTCVSIFLNTTNGTEQICDYEYNGEGILYQVISGPVFILVFTFTGIILSIFTDNFKNKRTLILACCLFWWSLMTFLTGFTTQVWQLSVLRFGLGLGQAGCNPIATSIIADYFSNELRGSALSIYNWGIYAGYSLTFAIGSAILKNLDWRWVYIIFGIPGFVVTALILTIKNKKKEETPKTSEEVVEIEMSNAAKLLKVAKEFAKPSVIMLCIAGSIRNAAGFVWANNNPAYYKALNQTTAQISQYLGVIPLVFGIIGSFVGGFVSDRVSKQADPSKRIWVLVISQLVAAPFVACVLFFDPPYSYYFLIPTYIFGEMWIGVCLSVLVELVPEKLRTTGVGFYFFIISNIGGNMQLLVPPVKSLFISFGLSEVGAFRGALYIFYPGEYVLGSLLFLLTLFVLKKDLKKTMLSSKNSDNDDQNPLNEETESYNEPLRSTSDKEE